jgi:hypothetical protein
MDRAEPPDEIHGVDSDDGPVGKELRKDSKGAPVVRIVEGGMSTARSET